MVITAALLVPIAKATYRVNEGEGYFRFRHARLKEFAECGKAGVTCAVSEPVGCGCMCRVRLHQCGHACAVSVAVVCLKGCL